MGAGMTQEFAATDPITGSRRRDVLALAAWVATLLAAVFAFHAVGSGALAAPPVAEPSALGEWFSAREPAEAAFALLRVLVLALAWYLLGVTTIGVLARLARTARLVALADVLTVPAVRRLLQGALGLGLATAAVTTATVPTPSALPDDDGRAVVASAEDRGSVTASALVEEGSDESVAAEADPLPPAGAPGDVHPGIDPDAPGERAAAAGFGYAAGAEEQPTLLGADDDGQARGDEAPRPALDDLPSQNPDNLPDEDEPVLRAAADTTEDADGPGADVWKIESGDHLWGVAEDTLTEAWDHAPDDAQVHAYWEQLIEANEDQLPDPGNPDLVHPGLQLTLPDIPTDPRV